MMVVFFLAAVSLLREDDNSCLWIPTFLVPAFLSTIVAVKPQLSGKITYFYTKCTLSQDFLPPVILSMGYFQLIVMGRSSFLEEKFVEYLRMKRTVS